MSYVLGLVLTLLLVGSAAAQESAAREADWYLPKYGKDDVIGAANNLSAEGTKRAAGLVTEGKVYPLGEVVGRKTPAFGHRWFKLVIHPLSDGSGAPQGTNHVTGNDDLLVSWLGIGTQIDGLGHVGIDHRYYNRVPIADIFDPKGLKKYGIETVPPIATRGVLLDMTRQFPRKKLKEGLAFNESEIEAAAKAQGVTIEKGDVVLFHTGWQRMAEKNPQRFLAGAPGLGIGGAEYLAELGVVAVGADTVGLEVTPSENAAEFIPVHQILIAENGVYILENVRTEELAADKAYTFLFVLGVPRIEGAVQMIVNPIAIR